MKNKKFESMVLDFVMAQMLHAHRLEKLSNTMGSQFGDCDLFDASRKTIDLFLNMAAMVIDPKNSENAKIKWVVETSPLGSIKYFVDVDKVDDFFGRYEVETVEDLLYVFKRLSRGEND